MAWIVGIGGFLLLLFMFPRAVGGLIGLIVLAVFAFFIWNKIESTEEKKRLDLVVVSIKFDIDRCGLEYPLVINVNNRSGETIERVSVSLSGHRSGYSNALYTTDYASYSSDKIIGPNEGWASCWRIPRPVYGASEQVISENSPDKLNWTISDKIIRFRGR